MLTSRKKKQLIHMLCRDISSRISHYFISRNYQGEVLRRPNTYKQIYDIIKYDSGDLFTISLSFVIEQKALCRAEIKYLNTIDSSKFIGDANTLFYIHKEVIKFMYLARKKVINSL